MAPQARGELNASHFHHVGIAVVDLTPVAERYEAALDAVLVQSGSDEKLAIDWLWLKVPGGVILELFSPTKEDGPIARFLDERGEGLHHVSFYVDSLDGAIAHIESLGEPLVGLDRNHAGYEEFFLDPDRFGGVLIHMFRELPN